MYQEEPPSKQPFDIPSGFIPKEAAVLTWFDSFNSLHDKPKYLTVLQEEHQTPTLDLRILPPDLNPRIKKAQSGPIVIFLGEKFRKSTLELSLFSGPAGNDKDGDYVDVIYPKVEETSPGKYEFVPEKSKILRLNNVQYNNLRNALRESDETAQSK